MSCGDSLGREWSLTKVRPSLSMDRGPWYYALLDYRVQENDQWSKEVVEGGRPSWYTMYISKSLITRALLTVEGKMRVPALLYDKSGITMGMVYDVFVSTARSCPGIDCGRNGKGVDRKLGHLMWYATSEDHEIPVRG
jgi:hypothetical protein